MSRLKVLPLLVIVAMLAFSVRLVEFVGGISALSGAAQAQAVEPDQSLLAAPVEQGETIELAQAETAAEQMPAAETTVTTTPTPVVPLASEGIGEQGMWRDSADESPGYEAMRIEVFNDLANRRDEIEKKERELVTREAMLKAAEQELDSKFQELVALRDELERLLNTQSEEEKARIASIVKVYEAMKPKEAARIFDTLDLDVLVSVVGQMSERRLSPILASMDPERARTVTIILAEQKQLPTLPHQGN